MNPFTIEPIAPGKYRVTNTLRGFSWVSHGHLHEVLESVAKLAAAEAKRLRKRGHGEAWRGRINVEQCEDARARNGGGR